MAWKFEQGGFSGNVVSRLQARHRHDHSHDGLHEAHFPGYHVESEVAACYATSTVLAGVLSVILDDGCTL